MNEHAQTLLRRLLMEQKKTNQLLTQQNALTQQVLEHQALLIQALAEGQDDGDLDADPQFYMDGTIRRADRPGG